MSGAQKAHPSLTLDETVHQRVRLGILAILSEATECTFPMGRRPCTWLALTRQGSRALRDEIAALEQLVRRLRRTQPADTGDGPAQSIQIDETVRAKPVTRRGRM